MLEIFGEMQQLSAFSSRFLKNNYFFFNTEHISNFAKIIITILLVFKPGAVEKR